MAGRHLAVVLATTIIVTSSGCRIEGLTEVGGKDAPLTVELADPPSARILVGNESLNISFLHFRQMDTPPLFFFSIFSVLKRSFLIYNQFYFTKTK